MAPKEWLQPLFSQSIAAYLDAQPVRDPALSIRLPEIHQYHLGQALYIDSTFEAQRFRRDAAWMARNDDVDHLALQMYVEGSNNVVNGAHEFRQKPGNIYAVNLAHEVQAVSEDSKVLTLILPRDLLAAELPQMLDSVGAVFANDSASGQVFCDHMQSLNRHLASATTGEIGSIMQGTLGLLDSLVRHGDITSSAAQGATLRSICSHIDRHLHDPALGVDSLCQQFRCSRATLYRLFAPLGGVREHIQRRRLMACFKAIVQQQQRLIYDIALDFGFVSPSHFSNLFRAYFGMTPRQAREDSNGSVGLSEPMPEAGQSARDHVEMMWRWGKTLAAGRSWGGAA
jgi:AraC-like DNA-binding protein